MGDCEKNLLEASYSPSCSNMHLNVADLAANSKLVPTAPEFIPKVFLQHNKVKFNNELSNGPSRGWWKQYKPALDNFAIEHLNLKSKWKTVNDSLIQHSYLENHASEYKIEKLVKGLESNVSIDLKKKNQNSDNLNSFKKIKQHFNTANCNEQKSYNHSQQKSSNKRWHGKGESHFNNTRLILKDNKRCEAVNQKISLVYTNSGSYIKNRSQYKKAKNISAASQRETLTFYLNKGTLECLVCCEFIKTFQPIWSCSECYHVLHLSCIHKWATTSKNDNAWRCPACQHCYTEVPNLYRCFCLKTSNPRNNKNDGAHTCGQICSRLGTYPCMHRCTLLCHPGPCTPCETLVYKKCACGASSRLLQCKQIEPFFCEKICNKMLNCHIHKCQKICHDGECGICEVKIKQVCHCEGHIRNVACSSETALIKEYCCGNICAKKLDCGNHHCRKICHDGPCESCLLVPEKISTCPCGKKKIEAFSRTDCTDPIPLCKAVCGKYLKCGPANNLHKCSSFCHEGPCPECPLECLYRCRCGHMDRVVKCSDFLNKVDVLCLKKCMKKRDCNKHKCNQVCCVLIEHACSLPCKRMLSCGLHRCDRNCHKGRCYPCWRSSFEELTCECGFSVMQPPIPCGTKRPSCNQPCSRQHKCNHSVLHSCHSDLDCPPCSVLSTKWCHGKHEMRKTIPCYQEDFSCGLACGKDLPCGKHTCLLVCHKGPCLVAGQVCNQPCTIPRPSCNHICKAPCHENACPNLACKEEVLVTCKCKQRSLLRTCSETSREYKRITNAVLASKMAEMQRGLSIDLQDILGNHNEANFNMLECTDDCRLIERNRRMLLGLQISNPNVTSKLSPRYSDFLKQWAKKDPSFVKNIHDKLTELVQLSKQSKQRFRSYSFPVMNKEKRHIVHELCEQFGVASVAYDPEPNRNIVATAEKEKCWLPSMSVLEVVQRENGQRKVPVPSLSIRE